MKKFLFSAALALSAAGVGAANLFLDNPVDLKTVTPAPNTTVIYFHSMSATDPFTLSADVDWSKYQVAVNEGDLLLDFSNGHHTLRMAMFFMRGANTTSIFRGGSFDLVKASQGNDFRFYYDQRADNRKYLLDDFNVKNVDYFWGIYGANNVCVLTNKSSISANNPVLFMNASSASMPNATNNVILVCDGSSLMGTSGTIQMDRGSWKSVAERTDNRLIVTGRGSFFGIKNNLYSSVTLGENSPGNSILFDDHSSGLFGAIYIGGYTSTSASGEDAKGNVMTIDNYSHVTNKQDVYIGYVVGADKSELNVLHGGELYTGEYNQIHVGYHSCHNRLNVIDGRISRCRNVTAGVYAGADYNTVFVSGPQAEVTGSQYRARFFGYGQHNEFIFDNCTAGSDTLESFFSSFSFDATIGTTNNTLKIQNNATYVTKTLSVNEASADNAILIADGGCLKVADALTVEGHENAVICSNGTLQVSTSADNVRIAAENRFVLQGTASKVEPIESLTAITLDAGAVLEFDAPKEGYAKPIFQGVGLKFDSGTRLVFKDLKTLQGQLVKTAEYQLTDGNGPLTIDGQSEGGHEELFANFFANAEGLVTGTSLGLKDVVNAQGQTVRALVLQVKSICGGVLLYR